MSFGKLHVYGRLTPLQWLGCWAFAIVFWAADHAHQLVMGAGND